MFTVNAPAKINWLLHVFPLRQDGYHEIRSLMQSVTLADSLIFEESDGLEVITGAPIPQEHNLVYKAMELLRKHAGVSAGARVTLSKEVPLSAGLGGGSSDAAAALLGLARLWNVSVSTEEFVKIGEELGSDVPFFFSGPAALVEGRGEHVSPITIRRSYAVLLVKPPIAVSTAWAYAEWDRTSSDSEVLTKKGNNIKLFCQALEDGDFSLLSTLQRNDLEPVVVRRFPAIDEIKQKLVSEGALFCSMSGSGPTVFAVFRSEAEAQKATTCLAPHWCRIARTLASN